MRAIIRILFTAVGVVLAANIVPGIEVAGFWTAVLVAIVLGILNVSLGAILKVLTLPLSIVTFGIFFLVINAFMFWLASFVKGFVVVGFWPAFFGSLIVTVVSMFGKAVLKKDNQISWN